MIAESLLPLLLGLLWCRRVTSAEIITQIDSSHHDQILRLTSTLSVAMFAASNSTYSDGASIPFLWFYGQLIAGLYWHPPPPCSQLPGPSILIGNDPSIATVSIFRRWTTLALSILFIGQAMTCPCPDYVCLSMFKSAESSPTQPIVNPDQIESAQLGITCPD